MDDRIGAKKCPYEGQINAMGKEYSPTAERIQEEKDAGEAEPKRGRQMARD